MIFPRHAALASAVILGALAPATSAQGENLPEHRSIATGSLKRIGEVDVRFQSFNVESVEVTGGNFWAPYTKPGPARSKPVAGPHGTEFATDAYEKREPIDLVGNRRLRVLAKALAPSYVRVSGSWANSIYFQDDDNPAAPPPAGYQGVMTRKQWAGLVEFAKAVDARILTSFPVSPGARNPSDGAWNPNGARRLFAYTRALGSRIDAVELMNEPNVSRTAYAPDDYARDNATLRRLIDEVSPGTLLVGPSSTGEAGFKLFATPSEQASSVRLLSGRGGPRFEVFSHHFYGAVSQRCKSLGERNGTEVTTRREEALSEAWLSRADQAQGYYRRIRDRFAPDAPIWITEMAQTACGGDPWSSTFLDTFRYVDQLGRLARQDVSIVFHNTLAASDYALIDDRTWLPRPNYWAALLWRRLVGEVVLDAGRQAGDLHAYAHCQKNRPGGVTVVVVNLSRTAQARLHLDRPAQRYTLTAPELESADVYLNGRRLALAGRDRLPALRGTATRRGAIALPPASITYLAVPGAANPACIMRDKSQMRWRNTSSRSVVEGDFVRRTSEYMKSSNERGSIPSGSGNSSSVPASRSSMTT